MSYVVAIDAGTTGVRALVVDETGTVVNVAYRELTQYFPRPGWVEHDPAEIWHCVRDTLIEVGTTLHHEGRTVAAVGITNQRETAVAFDRRTGTALGPAIVWQDRRTADYCDSLVAQGHLPMIRQRTGLVLDSYFTATKAHWMLQHGDLSPTQPGLSFATVDTWVLWHLTGGANGGVFATDASNASRTLLYDIGHGRWSDELCDLFGIPMHTLAEVRPSCGRLGTVQVDDLGPATSIFNGVPVSGMAGDQQAALFGQACFDSGMVKVTYGTGSFALANAGTRQPDPPDGLVVTVAWDLGHHGRSDEKVTYALEGSTFVSGAAVQWLRDGLGIIASASELGPLAESVADSGGVAFVPAFTGLGSPWWDPRARGTITGLTRGAGRAQIARALVEAMSFQVRDMTDAMTTAMGRSLNTVRVDGGAATMNLLLQLQADQSQVMVARPHSLESTALGAATLAGLAEGVWGSLDELATLWQGRDVFEPTIDQEIADLFYVGWQRAVTKAQLWSDDNTMPPSTVSTN